ncbi:histidinol-phosphate aminotransferase [Brevibacillus reuszeri]|uniref:Histidinol-phosphate aminotransferase n=1 Tax=Brevibacillus reuszeri TaxID=54915 RepID=A0A0K9YY52_9BACL|nr:histidinol-phosphate transaminase [Brevibacillus reuszeri]KNB73628.1 histidinol phosphate aminotransferase [Brevibacillus reuszeri]MED1858566.1 histidinol-phosphate transaminase [Brevibacillus reuszeri]GED69541.1 histidinol-phosphate aminotransferase [Brevibacillus reuszeri]
MTMILPHIERLSGYAQGEQPPEGTNAIRLNLNESSYPPSPEVIKALKSIPEETLRRYPDAKCDKLRSALAKHYGVREEQTFCSNGSSEIISLLMKVFIGPRGQIAIPDPSFPLYHSAAASYQVECIGIPTLDDFSIDVEHLIDSSAQAVVLVNPNAPTGLLLSMENVERLVRDFKGLIILDEAYIDFASGEASAISLIDRYPNLLVIRTFSKAYALCGARIGYCFGNEKLIAALEKGKDIYNVDSISRELALAALNDQSYMQATTDAIKRTRNHFSEQLTRQGFTVVPSHTNFILCKPPAALGYPTASELYEILMAQNIYVRYYQQRRLREYLRITIGTDAEMDAVLLAMSQILGQ